MSCCKLVDVGAIYCNKMGEDLGRKRHEKRHQEVGFWGLLGWSSGKECKEHGFDPWSRKVPHATRTTKPVGLIEEPTL